MKYEHGGGAWPCKPKGGWHSMAIGKFKDAEVKRKMGFPEDEIDRVSALDALEHLACKMDAMATLLSSGTEHSLILLKEDELFGIYLMLMDAVNIIRESLRLLQTQNDGSNTSKEA
jgi:hypothetical protein